MRTVYLDNNATTPVAPAVFDMRKGTTPPVGSHWFIGKGTSNRIRRSR